MNDDEEMQRKQKACAFPYVLTAELRNTLANQAGFDASSFNTILVKNAVAYTDAWCVASPAMDMDMDIKNPIRAYAKAYALDAAYMLDGLGIKDDSFPVLNNILPAKELKEQTNEKLKNWEEIENKRLFTLYMYIRPIIVAATLNHSIAGLEGERMLQEAWNTLRKTLSLGDARHAMITNPSHTDIKLGLASLANKMAANFTDYEIIARFNAQESTAKGSWFSKESGSVKIASMLLAICAAMYQPSMGTPWELSREQCQYVDVVKVLDYIRIWYMHTEAGANGEQIRTALMEAQELLHNQIIKCKRHLPVAFFNDELKTNYVISYIVHCVTKRDAIQFPLLYSATTEQGDWNSMTYAYAKKDKGGASTVYRKPLFVDFYSKIDGDCNFGDCIANCDKDMTTDMCACFNFDMHGKPPEGLTIHKTNEDRFGYAPKHYHRHPIYRLPIQRVKEIASSLKNVTLEMNTFNELSLAFENDIFQYEHPIGAIDEPKSLKAMPLTQYDLVDVHQVLQAAGKSVTSTDVNVFVKECHEFMKGQTKVPLYKAIAIAFSEFIFRRMDRSSAEETSVTQNNVFRARVTGSVELSLLQHCYNFTCGDIDVDAKVEALKDAHAKFTSDPYNALDFVKLLDEFLCVAHLMPFLLPENVNGGIKAKLMSRTLPDIYKTHTAQSSDKVTVKEAYEKAQSSVKTRESLHADIDACVAIEGAIQDMLSDNTKDKDKQKAVETLITQSAWINGKKESKEDMKVLLPLYADRETYMKWTKEEWNGHLKTVKDYHDMKLVELNNITTDVLSLVGSAYTYVMNVMSTVYDTSHAEADCKKLEDYIHAQAGAENTRIRIKSDVSKVLFNTITDSYKKYSGSELGLSPSTHPVYLHHIMLMIRYAALVEPDLTPGQRTAFATDHAFIETVKAELRTCKDLNAYESTLSKWGSHTFASEHIVTEKTEAEALFVKTLTGLGDLNNMSFNIPKQTDVVQQTLSVLEPSLANDAVQTLNTYTKQLEAKLVEAEEKISNMTVKAEDVNDALMLGVDRETVFRIRNKLNDHLMNAFINDDETITDITPIMNAMKEINSALGESNGNIDAQFGSYTALKQLQVEYQAVQNAVQSLDIQQHLDKLTDIKARLKALPWESDKKNALLTEVLQAIQDKTNALLREKQLAERDAALAEVERLTAEGKTPGKTLTEMATALKDAEAQLSKLESDSLKTAAAEALIASLIAHMTAAEEKEMAEKRALEDAQRVLAEQEAIKASALAEVERLTAEGKTPGKTLTEMAAALKDAEAQLLKLEGDSLKTAAAEALIASLTSHMAAAKDKELAEKKALEDAQRVLAEQEAIKASALAEVERLTAEGKVPGKTLTEMAAALKDAEAQLSKLEGDSLKTAAAEALIASLTARMAAAKDKELAEKKALEDAQRVLAQQEKDFAELVQLVRRGESEKTLKDKVILLKTAENKLTTLQDNIEMTSKAKEMLNTLKINIDSFKDGIIKDTKNLVDTGMKTTQLSEKEKLLQTVKDKLRFLEGFEVTEAQKHVTKLEYHITALKDALKQITSGLEMVTLHDKQTALANALEIVRGASIESNLVATNMNVLKEQIKELEAESKAKEAKARAKEEEAAKKPMSYSSSDKRYVLDGYLLSQGILSKATQDEYISTLDLNQDIVDNYYTAYPLTSNPPRDQRYKYIETNFKWKILAQKDTKCSLDLNDMWNKYTSSKNTNAENTEGIGNAVVKTRVTADTHANSSVVEDGSELICSDDIVSIMILVFRDFKQYTDLSLPVHRIVLDNLIWTYNHKLVLDFSSFVQSQCTKYLPDLQTILAPTNSERKPLTVEQSKNLTNLLRVIAMLNTYKQSFELYMEKLNRYGRYGLLDGVKDDAITKGAGTKCLIPFINKLLIFTKTTIDIITQRSLAFKKDLSGLQLVEQYRAMLDIIQIAHESLVYIFQKYTIYTQGRVKQLEMMALKGETLPKDLLEFLVRIQNFTTNSHIKLYKSQSGSNVVGSYKTVAEAVKTYMKALTSNSSPSSVPPPGPHDRPPRSSKR